MGRLAIHLRSAVIKVLGCDESDVTHYSYKHGELPKYDEYKAAKNGWASISGGGKPAWVFALGIQLEIGPNTHPKLIAVCPFDVTIGTDSFSISSTLFRGKESVSFTQPPYTDDLDRVAEAIFQGLKQGLEEEAASGSPSGKFGFSAPDL